MLKGDYYVKENIKRILEESDYDLNDRPHYVDGKVSRTISVNHVFNTYETDKGELPLSTLRPLALKGSIGEMLWIYRDADNNVYNLETKYNVRWWRDWVVNKCHYNKDGVLMLGENPYIKDGFYYDISGHKLLLGEKSDTVNPITDKDDKNILDAKTGNVLTHDANIGSTYGSIIKRNDIFNNLIKDIKENPGSRYHIMNMWQYDDLKMPKGLPPCAYETIWNVRRGGYLDMMLTQRSSDYMTAGVINPTQYTVLLYMVAHELNLKPGRFSWIVANMQIYDRHIENAKELLKREPVDYSPSINVADVPLKEMMPDDIEIKDFPKTLIKKKNPQMHFDIGI